MVGDSLEVLTSPYLQQYLPSASLTINAEGGYNSLQIYKLFQESYDPSQSVIVFDAGTNDNPAYPEILAGRLQAVAQQIGGRCMVVPTIHGLTVNGVNSAGKNRVVREFAASRPGTQTPDWANVGGDRPGVDAVRQPAPGCGGSRLPRAPDRARGEALFVRGILGRVEIRPASMPRVRMRQVIAVLTVAVVVAGLGVGAYFVGDSGGEDLAAAHAAGARAGAKSGEHRGQHRGYARGFKWARSQSFQRAYDAAFRGAYANAFRKIGVPPPRNVNVPHPGRRKEPGAPGD